MKLHRLISCTLSLIMTTSYFSWQNTIFASGNTTAEANNYTVKASKTDNDGLFYDIFAYSVENGYEFLLPENVDESALKITISDEDDEIIFDGDVDLSQDKSYTLKTPTGEVLLSSVISNLSILYLNIDEEHGTIENMNKSPDHSESCYGDMTLYVPDELSKLYDCDQIISSVENDEKEDTPGTMRIRGRGNSTWTTHTDKQRPYQIKLEKSLNILGMGKGKDWALLRSETGTKYLNNKICYDMAGDFGLKNSPRAQMTDVYMNGKYIGMYTMTNTIKVNSNSVPITDIDGLLEDGANPDDIDITGGYLLEIDNNPEDLQFKTNQNNITIKAPEELDTTAKTSSRYDYIKNLMSDLFDAVYGDGYLSDGRHFTELLDMDSAVKYFLLQELTGNHDAGRGSTYFYKDTDSIDPKIYLGPVWDSDAAFEYYSGHWTLYNRKLTWIDDDDLNYTFLSELCSHREFLSLLNAYYFDNMNNNNIMQIYSSYKDKISEYENLCLPSAQATSRLYDLDAPSFSHIPTYIDEKLSFMNNNLEKLHETARCGENIVYYQFGKNSLNTDIEAEFSSVQDSLEYTLKNTSDTKKDVLMIFYENNKNLLGVNKIITLAPSETLTDSIKLSKNCVGYYVNIYSENSVDTYSPVPSSQHPYLLYGSK